MGEWWARGVEALRQDERDDMKEVEHNSLPIRQLVIRDVRGEWERQGKYEKHNF